MFGSTSRGEPDPRDPDDGVLITAQLARRIAPSPGLRNLLTHRYGEVHQRVADAAVDDYREYVAQVSRWLLDTDGCPGAPSSRPPASQD